MYRKDYLKMEELKDGYLYEIIARNAKYGIWRSMSQGFIISRIRFGDNFLFEEHHYDCEGLATAQPIKEIERSPFTIKDLTGELEEKEREFWQYPIVGDKKSVLEYLNKFEGDRAYQWPKK
jgi:hypothetical protein